MGRAEEVLEILAEVGLGRKIPMEWGVRLPPIA